MNAARKISAPAASPPAHASEVDVATLAPWRQCCALGCSALTRSRACPRHGGATTSGRYITVATGGGRGVAIEVDLPSKMNGYRWCVRWLRAHRRWHTAATLSKFLGVAIARDIELAELPTDAVAQLVGAIPHLEVRSADRKGGR